MHIGFLGTGRAANALASRWASAGHAITLGSREPSKHGKQQQFPVVSQREAVDVADVVVNAIPGAGTLEALKALGAEPFAGKTLIDIANAITFSDGLLLYPNDSLGQRVQQLLPGARVVKTLNTLNISVMTNPEAYPPTSVFVSGDDQQAKQQVTTLLGDLGWPAEAVLDLGPIATARGSEYYFIMFYHLYRALGTTAFNIRVVHGASPGD